MSKKIADGSVIIDIEANLDKFNTSLGSLTKASIAGFAAMKAAVIAVGAAIVSTGKEFETAQAKVSTLFGDTNVNVSNLNSKILELSSTTGIAASSMSQALYSALSAGVEVTEDMSTSTEFLETNAKLAVAGFTDVDSAVNATAKVLNAYGMATDEVDRVSKVLIQTQNKGITTVDELSSVLSQVTPTAAAMNVSFEQVGASLSVLTAQGTKTAQATTELNTMFAELGKSGTTGANNLTEALKGTEYAGKTFSQLMADGVQLNTVLDLMSKYAGDNSLSLIDMFSSIEAGKAALSITQATETYTEDLQAMSTSADVVGDAYSKMMDTVENKSAQLKESITNIGISLYDEMSGSIKDGLDVAIEAVKDLSNTLSGSDVKELIAEIGTECSNLIKVLSNMVKTVLPALLSALKWAIQYLPGIAAGFVTFKVAIFACNTALKAYTVVSTAVKAATSGTSTVTGFLTAALGKQAAASKLAAAAMQLFNASNPVGWVTLAVSAITALGVAFALNAKKTDQYGYALEEVNKKAEEHKKSIEDMNQAALDSYATSEASINKAKEYGEAIASLCDSEGSYAANKDQVISLVDQFNQQMGETILTYDTESDRIVDQNGKVVDLTESLQNLIEIKKAEAVVSAYSEEYAAALKSQSESQQQYAEDLTKRHDLSKQYSQDEIDDWNAINEAISNGTGFDDVFKMQNDFHSAYGDTYADLVGWQDELRGVEADITYLEGVMSDNTGMISFVDNLNAAIETAQNTGDFSGISDALIQMNSNMQMFDTSKGQEQIQALSDQVANYQNTLDTLKQAQAEGNVFVTDDMVSSAQTNLDAANEQLKQANEKFNSESNASAVTANAEKNSQISQANSDSAVQSGEQTRATAVDYAQRAASDSKTVIESTNPVMKIQFQIDYDSLNSAMASVRATIGSASFERMSGSSFDGSSGSVSFASRINRMLSGLNGQMQLSLAGAGMTGSVISSNPTIVYMNNEFNEPWERPSQVSKALEETSRNLVKGK